jgi:hypothetical protein
MGSDATQGYHHPHGGVGKSRVQDPLNARCRSVSIPRGKQPDLSWLEKRLYLFVEGFDTGAECRTRLIDDQHDSGRPLGVGLSRAEGKKYNRPKYARPQGKKCHVTMSGGL